MGIGCFVLIRKPCRRPLSAHCPARSPSNPISALIIKVVKPHALHATQGTTTPLQALRIALAGAHAAGQRSVVWREWRSPPACNRCRPAWPDTCSYEGTSTNGLPGQTACTPCSPGAFASLSALSRCLRGWEPNWPLSPPRISLPVPVLLSRLLQALSHTTCEIPASSGACQPAVTCIPPYQQGAARPCSTELTTSPTLRIHADAAWWDTTRTPRGRANARRGQC